MFIADRVFPMVPVSKQSDRYFVYTRADWLRNEAQLRGPASESAGGGWAIDNTPTYYADVWAVHKDVDDQTRQNADAAINMDRDATEYVTQQLWMKRDQVWASKFFNTGIWTTNLTGVAAAPGANQFLRWDEPNSTPIDDITAQIMNIASLTGFKPNKLVLGPQVYNALRNSADVLDRIKYTQRGVVTTDLLASLMDLDEVVVPMSVTNTAIQGATENTAFVFGKSALLVYSAPNPGLLTPSAGYIFTWNGLLGAGAYGNRIKRFRMDWLAADRVEGELAFDCKLIAPELGCFFTTAVS